MSRRTSAGKHPSGLWRSNGGNATVEFALVLPIVLTLSLGAAEGGLMVFEYHRAGEAMRSLARKFEIDPPVTSLSGLSVGTVTCPGSAGCDAAKLDAAVAAVRGLLPSFSSANLNVVYRASGLDDDVATPGVVTPTVTVSLVGWQYRFAVLRSVVPGLADTFTLPPFSTTRVVATQVR